MRTRTIRLPAVIHHHPAVDEIDAQEQAGDPYADIVEESECPCDPAGHLVKSQCGICRCVGCRAIV